MLTPMLPMRRPGLEVRIVDDEAVILDVANGRVHQLNATATVVWNACDGTHSLSDLATLLATDFDGTADALLGDVVNTVMSLARLGLLEGIDGSDGPAPGGLS